MLARYFWTPSNFKSHGRGGSKYHGPFSILLDWGGGQINTAAIYWHPLLFYYFLIGGSKYYGCNMFSSSYFKSHSNQIKFYTPDILIPLVISISIGKGVQNIMAAMNRTPLPISNSIREGKQNIMVAIYWNIFLLFNYHWKGGSFFS